METEPNRMVHFNIENPPDYFTKRASNASAYSEDGEDNVNENIIFNNNSSSSIALQRNNTKALQSSYCGIKGDSELSCILNVVVSAIGSNTFTFSYIIYDSGIIAAFLIFIFVTAGIFYSIELLRSFIVDTKFYSFALMTETILGKKWLKIYGVSSLIVYLSMVVYYKKMMYTYIMGIFGKENDINYVYKLIYYFSIAAVEIIVILFTKNTKIQILSIVSLFCFTAILLCIIGFSIKNLSNDYKKFAKENFFPLNKNNSTVEVVFDILSHFTTFVYGYCYHATFPTLIGNLSVVNNATTKKVHLISFSIIFSAFFLISFFGYTYSETVKRMLFIENLDEIDDRFVTVLFKIIVSLFFLTLIPIRFIIIRDSYTIVIGQKKYTLKQEVLLTTLFIILSNTIVFLMNLYQDSYDSERLSYFLQIFGGIFGVIICFILPVINYVSVNGKTKIKSIVGYIITGIFCVICVFSQGYSLYKFIAELFEDETSQ